MSEAVSILIVDDRDEDLLAMKSVLSSPKYELVFARSGREALRKVLERDYAVILLDVVMPGLDGFEVASIIKQRERSRHTPIIFLSGAAADLAFIYKGYSSGAVDCLMKPVDADVVRAKVAIFAELFRKDQHIKRQAQELREAEAREREVQLAELRVSSERRYQNLAEAIPQVVWIAGPDGKIEYANQHWTTLTGLELHETRESGWTSVIHPNDVESTQAAWRDSVERGEVYQSEYRIMCRDGTHRWHLTRAVPERADDGSIVRWLGTTTDIDDLRAAQAAAEEARRRSEFLADASVVLSSSLEQRTTLASLARLAVPSLGDWCLIDMGSSDLSLLEPETAVEVATLRLELGQRLRDQVADQQTVDLMVKLGLSGALVVPMIARGERLGSIVFARSDEGRRYEALDVAMAEDIGRRAGVAIDNGRLFSEAQQAIRARDEFLSVASHELKTPLTSLDLQIQSLQRKVQRGEQVSGFQGGKLEMVERQVDRLTGLIDNLLDVSRVVAGQLVLDLQDTDFAEVVRDVMARFRDQLQRAACPIELNQVDGTYIGHWDRLRLEQVFTNLLTNALKYGPGKPILVNLSSEHDRVVLSVRDHGMGIAPEDQARIFERFERAASVRHFGGLGLGLWIVRQIVEALEGKITVESSPGEGSLFTVSLPRRPAVQKSPLKVVQQAHA